MALEWYFALSERRREGIIPQAIIFYVFDRDGWEDFVL